MKNQIEIILKLNVGLRLFKSNFLLKFGSGQSHSYSITATNSKYTSYQLDIYYYETIAKETLTIKVVSPLQ